MNANSHQAACQAPHGPMSQVSIEACTFVMHVHNCAYAVKEQRNEKLQQLPNLETIDRLDL